MRPPRHRLFSRRRASYRGVLAGAACALLVGGWAPPPDWISVGREASTIRAACERQHIAGLIPTRFDTEHCADQRIAELYSREGYPLLDVLINYLAQREAIAAKVDQGVISANQEPAELALARDSQNRLLQKRGVDPALLDPAVFSLPPTPCLKQGFINQLCN